MADDDTPEDDEVGYAKPPRKHQYKPGQSGNPKGRPKGSGNIHKSIAKHAGRKVKVMVDGEEKKMPRVDVLISAMFNKASKGDVAAARLITSLLAVAKELEGGDYEPSYSEEDRAVMQREAAWQAKLVSLREEGSDEGF